MPLYPYKQISPSIAPDAWVDPSAVLYGDIHLGAQSSIWPLVAARGDVNHIRIGKRSNIQDACVLHVSRLSETNPQGHPLIIGDDVTVGHKAMLHGCTLGNRVLVGMGAIILDGVIVDDEVIIAAGSVVPPNKHLDSGFIYMGNPVRQARPISAQERAFLSQSAMNYVKLAQEYAQV